MSRKASLRIIVSGLAASVPVGGMAWHYMQYVIGLHRMGHEVYYHEDTWSWPFNPVKNAPDPDGTYSAAFLEDFFETHAPDLRQQWHYLHLHEKSFGMSAAAFNAAAGKADIFLNISGSNFIPDQLPGDCTKVFVDTDPGYNQIMLTERFDWSEFVDRWCDQFAAHDQYYTFAEAINEQWCGVPRAGVDWKTTRMPIVIDYWKSGDVPAAAPWTSIMTWNVFKGKLEFEGVEYGDKSVEFDKIVNLPSRSERSFLVGVGGSGAPVDHLTESGWQVVSAPAVTKSPSDYRNFIASSRGEVSVAKNVYVALKTGWFSERSACYLASGRPVVLQDTGFSHILPTGTGLLSFVALEDAAEAVEAMERDYERHAKGALEIAHACFDHRRVLNDLLESLS